MQWAKQKQSGFTIVELLIVVVVIAILAAITIVSYNGITERARASGASSFAAQIKHRDLGDAIGYWSFDECSGSSVTNTAGSAASASNTIGGTVSWSTDTPSGSGCSLSFNGTSTFIGTGMLLSNTYYMKSAWIKSTASTNGNIMSGSGSAAAFYLPNGRPSAGHNGSWNLVQHSSALNDGKWHFVSVEFIGTSSAIGTLKLTVDGSTVVTKTDAATISDISSSTQTIGNFNGGNYFSGLMDDVMLVVK